MSTFGNNEQVEYDLLMTLLLLLNPGLLFTGLLEQLLKPPERSND